MEIQQESLDKVKRPQVEILRQPPSPPPQLPVLKLPHESGQVTTVIPPGALTNHGPPLLTNQHGLPVSYGVVITPTSSSKSVGYAKPPKLDFPKFFGENPRLWLGHCRTYFEMYRVPVMQWVAKATLYMDGHAALCLQAYKRQHVVPGWDLFYQVVEDEFGSDEYDAQMNKLLQLKQTGTVAKYLSGCLRGKHVMYHLLSLDATLNGIFIVT